MSRTKAILVLGWLLILVGAGALFLNHARFREEEKVLDLGPIEAKVIKEKRFEQLPVIFGVIVIASGIALLYIGKKRK